MKKFNLAEFIIKKEAMGYTRQRYRDQYEWWDYEELMGGADDRWQEWVRTDRSLSDVLRDAGQIRNKLSRRLMGLYGLPLSEIPKIFKTYIGYHPTYGAYICSIGPYLGSTFESSQDKFGYFIIRKRKSSREEMMDAVGKNINKYTRDYGIAIEPSDLQFVVKAPAGEYDPSRARQRKNIREVVVNLDPESPEGRDFYERAPIAGEGSSIGLNAKGLEKVIRGQWGPLYEQAVREISQREGISEDEVRGREIRDLDFLKGIYDAVRRKYDEAVESGAAAIEGMNPPPRFSELSFQGKSGQIQFTTIKSNPKEVIRQLQLRQEILTLLNAGTDDPVEIQARLNQDPRRQRNPIPIEEVQDRVADIRNISESEEKSLSQLEEDVGSQITSYETNSGFDDLNTAFEQAKLYFTNHPIDPLTKGKLRVQYAPKMAFDPPENFENVTADDLVRLRAEREEAIAAGDVATEEDIERELGEEITPQEVQPEEEVVEEVQPEIIEEEEEIIPQESIGDLFSSTIGNLIKIAKELDDAGESYAAEEIHKVIRKYRLKKLIN